MIRGLQETGQSVDIELLRPLVIAYSDIFHQKFKGRSKNRVRMTQEDRVTLICRARDEAEVLLRVEKGEDEQTAREGNVWTGHLFSCF